MRVINFMSQTQALVRGGDISVTEQTEQPSQWNTPNLESLFSRKWKELNESVTQPESRQTHSKTQMI